MKTRKSLARSIVSGAVALTLAIGSAGVASATEPTSPISTSSAVNTAPTYPTPSAEDVALYGTDDPEMVYLLNQMSEEFAKYGAQGAYDDLIVGSDAPLPPGTVTIQSWDTFASCVGNGLAKSFGLDILKRAFNHEVRNALKSRKWKVASSIMHRNISRYLGKKAASVIIKKIASKALPGGLPGQIAWQVAKCGVKEIW